MRLGLEVLALVVAATNLPASDRFLSMADQARASVSVSYESFSPIDERVWLSVRNDSGEKILLSVLTAPETQKEAGVCYELLTEGSRDEMPPTPACTEASPELTVPTGRAIEFGVPVKHLGEGCAVRVRVRYLRPTRDRAAKAKVTETLVSFSHTDLPEWLQRYPLPMEASASTDEDHPSRDLNVLTDPLVARPRQRR